MKIVVPQEEFLSRLQIVARGVSQRATVQILSGVLIRAESSGAVELAATDMEISLRASLEAQVDEPGSTVLTGRLLLEIVRALPAQPVTIEQPGGAGAVKLTCGSSEYTLHAQGAEDFPHLPEASGPSFGVDRAAFVHTINHVARAASKDESRPVLTGVLVEFGQGTVTMAATDSYRLSVKEAALPGAGGDAQAIVPARALTELARIATAAGSDTIDVAIGENQIVFGVEGVSLSARRIDGQFPNYRQLVPEAFEHEIPASREELLDVVRRTSSVLLAHRALPLRLAFDQGRLTISAQTQDVGEAHESMPVDFHGERIEIGFNAEFLRDGIESVEGDTVKLKLTSPLRPGLVQGEDGSFSYLIMPIRLST
jgi:DNA polymerase-3 subunit beta